MLAPPTQETLSPFDSPRFSLDEDPATSTEAYTSDEVAAIATDRIMAMSRPELIEVIRSVRGGHLRPGVLERLPHMDCETLRRLVFVTRRYCRNRQAMAEPDASASAVVISWC